MRWSTLSLSRSHYGIEHWLSNILVFSIVVDHQKKVLVAMQDAPSPKILGQSKAF
jgi:hypothetical protein